MLEFELAFEVELCCRFPYISSFTLRLLCHEYLPVPFLCFIRLYLLDYRVKRHLIPGVDDKSRCFLSNCIDRRLGMSRGDIWLNGAY